MSEIVTMDKLLPRADGTPSSWNEFIAYIKSLPRPSRVSRANTRIEFFDIYQNSVQVYELRSPWVGRFQSQLPVRVAVSARPMTTSDKEYCGMGTGGTTVIPGMGTPTVPHTPPDISQLYPNQVIYKNLREEYGPNAVHLERV